MKFAGLLALCLAGTAGAEPLPVNRDAVWFKPSLTVSSAPICAEILRVEQDTFFSTRDQSEYAQAGWEPIDRNPATNTVPHVEFVKDRYGGELILTRPDGQRVFTQIVSQGGCGGGCETTRILLSSEPFDPSRRLNFEDEWPGTPRAPEWRLYQAPDGEFYALGIVDNDRLHAYRLAGPAKAELTCEVTLKPKQFADNADPSIKRAWQSIEALRRAYSSVSQDAGNCGTLQAHGRRYWHFEQSLQEALYRPWAAHMHWGELSPIDLPLDAWALVGIAEYRARQHYRGQVERAIQELAGFYRQKLAWPKAEAQQQAAAVIRNALDRGFAFSSYYQPAESQRPLRQAILERQPMDVIKQLAPGEPSKEQEEMGFTYESVLNVAIEYPEALRYLLSKGLDPNVTNAFGKTPLMYAAQLNQIESASILLAAGADPNASTYLPQDDCYYTLRTSGMTPLHYAARYASAPLVMTLVAHGAATFAWTHRAYPEAKETPLDWLKRHTGNAPKTGTIFDADVEDMNPNIRTAELPALYEVLRVPSDEDRRQTSATLLARAQAEYAKGEYKPAYRSLKLALSAQPDNEKAQADFPLVAFKAGEPRAAIKAARRSIENTTSVPLQASAWFNLGVICERKEVRDQYFREARCDQEWIMPFVQAWQLQPTRARADKIRQIFAGEGADSCASSGERYTQRVWSFKTHHGQSQRVHILHSVDDPLEITPMPEMTRVIDALPVQDLAITVLEYPPNDVSLKINGQACGG